MRRGSCIVTMFVASGCVVGNPATGRRSGEPLRVRVDSTATITSSAGEDRGARYVGHSYLQGTQPIDEQDFFRLANDRQSLDQVQHHRARARRTQAIGRWMILGTVIVSGALIAAGLATDTKGLWITGIAIPVVPAIVGGVLMFSGRSAMAKTPVVAVERARAAAEEVDDCVDDRCRIIRDRPRMPRPVQRHTADPILHVAVMRRAELRHAALEIAVPGIAR